MFACKLALRDSNSPKVASQLLVHVGDISISHSSTIAQVNAVGQAHDASGLGEVTAGSSGATAVDNARDSVRIDFGVCGIVGIDARTATGTREVGVTSGGAAANDAILAAENVVLGSLEVQLSHQLLSTS